MPSRCIFLFRALRACSTLLSRTNTCKCFPIVLLSTPMPLDLIGSKVMTVYVAAIKGRGIAAFYAENGAAAMVRVLDPLFRDDLMVLATDGLPLWDGMADIQVRPAFPEEEARWRASRAKAIRHGNIEREDDTWIAFLVALTDLDRRRR